MFEPTRTGYGYIGQWICVNEKEKRKNLVRQVKANCDFIWHTSNDHIFRKVAVYLFWIWRNGRFIEANERLPRFIGCRHMSCRRNMIIRNGWIAIDYIFRIDFIVLREKFDDLHLSAGLIDFSFPNRMHQRCVRCRICTRGWLILFGLWCSWWGRSCCWCWRCGLRSSSCWCRRSGGSRCRCCCHRHWSGLECSHYERFNVVRTIFVLEVIHCKHFIRLAHVLAIYEPIRCHVGCVRQTRCIGCIEFNRLIQWNGTRYEICFTYCSILWKK